jgi:3-deoxy-manno-octulosonate cytidylyltransferase (CMP-KDO synthetase)
MAEALFWLALLFFQKEGGVMRIIGVIPARYASSRFPGKPLADIHGKPMVWWVYQQAKKVERLNEVYVATDDERIAAACREHDMRYVMTSDKHLTPTSRICEVSETIQADYYVNINGDEPLIKSSIIASALYFDEISGIYVGSVAAPCRNPVESFDPANFKVILNANKECIYISRSQIPFPKGTLSYEFLKYIGVNVFNREALRYFSATPRDIIEDAEDIELLRFINNGIRVHFTLVDCSALSVDSVKDLEQVRKILSSKETLL